LHKISSETLKKTSNSMPPNQLLTSSSFM
jgi:hypothetical protein